ncbi:MAG: DUF5106 domain-containing protein [Salinivirgaceae bacterium]|jgi:thiol-disulfide isomerase/thioredoxin|nr:DUF5106 domain-containing protein [Salinivirgaceae bacterium]
MHFKLKLSLIIVSFVLTGAQLIGQKLDISLQIKGLENKDVIIAHHYGENTLIDDTVSLNIAGEGHLVTDSTYEKGLYLCIFPDKTYFEFILGDDQEFHIETTATEDSQTYVKDMKVSGSALNADFIDYQNFMMEMNQKSNDLRQALKNDPNNQEHKEALQALNESVQTKWKSIKTEHPGSFLEKMFDALQEIEVPEPPRDADGIITDSTFQYNYYNRHYFDNVDFSDNQMLYSPIYHRKLKHYFDKVVIRRPDSVIAASDRLLNSFPDDTDYFQYTLAFIFNKYAKSKYMGFDQIIVHLAENYYLNGRATWVSDEYLDKLRERVIKLKPNLIGSVAPKLDKAQSIEGYFYPLHEVEAKYTVVAFYEPSCGHCKKEIPKMYSAVFQDLHEYNVQVYAFYTQADQKEWQKFITDKGLTDWINVWDPQNFTDFRNKYDVYSTPTIYLLDSEKRIIAKRVDVETIISIIEEKERQ